jgi:hypothetical protein
MKDLFANLLDRARGRAPLTPVLPARFEPVLPGQEPWGEAEGFVAPRAAGELASPARGERREPSAPAPAPRATPLAPVPAASEPPGRVERIVRTIEREGVTAESSAPVLRGPIETPLDLAAIVAEALRARVVTGTTVEPTIRAVEGADASPREGPGRPAASVVAATTAPVAPAAQGPPEREPRLEPPAVEVRIGRIEVTAAPPPRPAPAPRPSRPPAVAMSLGDYLTRRGRR